MNKTTPVFSTILFTWKWLFCQRGMWKIALWRLWSSSLLLDRKELFSSPHLHFSFQFSYPVSLAPSCDMLVLEPIRCNCHLLFAVSESTVVGFLISRKFHLQQLRALKSSGTRERYSSVVPLDLSQHTKLTWTIMNTNITIFSNSGYF